MQASRSRNEACSRDERFGPIFGGITTLAYFTPDLLRRHCTSSDSPVALVIKPISTRLYERDRSGPSRIVNGFTNESASD